MKVTIYGIKNCDTMKKAFTWLEKNKVDYVFHDYKKEGAPPAKLKAWSKQVGWEKLANSRGPTWRKIPEAERENLNEAKALALLEKNTSAIKRPVIEAGATLLVGFDEMEFSKALK